jgi:hypothetical protein
MFRWLEIVLCRGGAYQQCTEPFPLRSFSMLPMPHAVYLSLRLPLVSEVLQCLGSGARRAITVWQYAEATN